MKFAYLIMAHDNEQQLRLLLEALDHKENDIYLHLDKKSELKWMTFETQRACLNVYCKFSVYWGDISQTKCQIFLLNEATKSYHDYYHLISGHDFPIKAHEEILAFFKKNAGKQFIHFESKDYCMKETCRYYHVFAPLLSRCHDGYLKNIICLIEKIILDFQRNNDVKRELFCGANWYSITHDLAQEFCSKQNEVLKRVRWTISSDEYVLQTFFKSIATGKYVLFAETKEPNDYYSTTREIDWYRGSPYVWRSEDFDYLMKSDRMYARKFDLSVDSEILKQIGKVIGREN
ncbi:MAG: hypothetical protein IK111_04215 [Lachnospiraceae bacterium]|nr:hypothetical protein [Lachnospiraceae bacterium]